MPSAQKTREHVRCPCCGRLAAKRGGEVLPAALRPDHELGAMVQTFTAEGRGAGFRWAPRPLRDDEAAALGDVVAEIAERLGREAGGASITDSEATLRAELERCRRRNTQLRKTLRLAAIELRSRQE